MAWYDSILNVASGVSSWRIYAIIAVIMTSMVGYHFFVVSGLEKDVAVAQKATSEETAKLEKEKTKHQSDLNELAAIRSNFDTLQKLYEIDVKGCKVRVETHKGHVTKARVTKEDLEKYVKENPDTILKTRVPDEVIDILNGGKK